MELTKDVLIAEQLSAGLSVKKIWGEMYYNVKEYRAKGNGVKDDTGSIADAISAASTTGGYLLFPPGTYLTGAQVIPSNVTVLFVNGAKLSIKSGETITINGPIEAGVYQIFSGSGTVEFNHAVTTVGYPEWWGAVTGGPDCLPALQAATKALPTVYLQSGDYFISNTLEIMTPNRSLIGSIEYQDTKGTRIVVVSSTADVIFIGLKTNPGNPNNFLKQVTIKYLQVTRDRVVTPPSSGSEINGAAGIRCQYTLFTYLERVRSNEHTIGFCLNGTVQTHLTECYAFRSLAGNSATNDIFYGYFLNGNASIGLAGGNASTYFTDCNASIGGAPALTTSYGYLLSGKPVDTFMLRPESSSCRTGIGIYGDSSISGNADVHIINPIIDVFAADGIRIDGVGSYGAINVMGGYYAPGAGSFTCFGIRILNCTGMISLTNNQALGYMNGLMVGLWVENSTGVASRSNQYLGSLRPICLINSSNNMIEDVINNPAQVATQGAVYLTGSNRNYISTLVKGQAGAFPKGVELVGTTNGYNEIRCTPIDPGCITGGSANKLVINGVQVTTAGASGTNLASGIMN